MTTPNIQRWFENDDQAHPHMLREKAGFSPHVGPFSVFIAAMGSNWEPECKEAVEAMAYRVFEEHHDVVLYEQPDLCMEPFDAMGTMRNEAANKARLGGFEYILYLDNDIKPEPEVLLRLLYRNVPVIAPAIHYSTGEDYGLNVVKATRNQGLAMVRSTLVSIVLFRTDVFTPFHGSFWADAIGAHEQFHWEKLEAVTGHRLFLDTDLDVEIVKPPHFPLDYRELDYREDEVAANNGHRPE